MSIFDELKKHAFNSHSIHAIQNVFEEYFDLPGNLCRALFSSHIFSHMDFSQNQEPKRQDFLDVIQKHFKREKDGDTTHISYVDPEVGRTTKYSISQRDNTWIVQTSDFSHNANNECVGLNYRVTSYEEAKRGPHKGKQLAVANEQWQTIPRLDETIPNADPEQEHSALTIMQSNNNNVQYSHVEIDAANNQVRVAYTKRSEYINVEQEQQTAVMSISELTNLGIDPFNYSLDFLAEKIIEIKAKETANEM